MAQAACLPRLREPGFRPIRPPPIRRARICGRNRPRGRAIGYARYGGSDGSLPGALPGKKDWPASRPVRNTSSSAAAVLAKRLKLPGPSHRVIQACRDKHRCRQVLAKAGIAQPRFRQTTSVKQAIAAARELGFPVVVKAVSGSGGLGVLLCRDEREVADHAASVLRQRHNERGLPVPRRILVESFIDGPHISVETFNNQIIGVTKNHLGSLPHFVEIGHDFPARLPRASLRAVHDTVARVFRGAAALGTGPHSVAIVPNAASGADHRNQSAAGGWFHPRIGSAGDGRRFDPPDRPVGCRLPKPRTAAQHRYASTRFILAPCAGILGACIGAAKRVEYLSTCSYIASLASGSNLAATSATGLATSSLSPISDPPLAPPPSTL